MKNNNEEYRKKIEEKEKKLKEEIQNYRRRSVYILFVNIIVVLVIFFLFKNINVSSKNLVDGFQIVIKHKQEFYSDEYIDAKVYLINTRNGERSFVINNFRFKIVDENNVPVYNFYYDSTVNSRVGKLSSVLVFDLRRETAVKTLKKGIYNIIVELNLNGNKINVEDTFEIKEEVLKELKIDPFYLVEEEIYPQLMFENKTSTSVILNINSIEWNFNDKMFKDVLSENYKLFSGEKLFLESSKPFIIDKAGIYNVKCNVYYNNRLETISKEIVVIDKPEKNLEGLSLRIYSNEYLKVNSPINFIFEVSNLENREKYLVIDKVNILIPEQNYSYETRNVKVLLNKYGAINLVELPLTFREKGKYTIIFRIVSGKEISKVLTINIE
ncbi:hypothetical protein SU69_06470 [Thermosipho melanesiensis]|uniref:Uncharacterized protein n=2 Tax=Thermosipho melanesiensis TaxID=46541 RepID=A6LMH5_THEM4|nr:hypothetical protein [Thermosipho melanesiensis]ABR31126.1 hypothetical protein Tmel_1277 [Thermosipho melanesiensis BI429]APT74217.1 hypothetical protein BW47_06790 [Thermosipho melanesiensis]OOC36161.1 hypothetical protein SU68_06540 [Thermosipho melanesiensis]OOC36978.1 hypothetical protein SU69_06470 [Thermosipho melanesiensis]OOC37730.1 hypothetical protein SU70_06480 [Thermosipho melanesiensis]